MWPLFQLHGPPEDQQFFFMLVIIFIVTVASTGHRHCERNLHISGFHDVETMNCTLLNFYPNLGISVAFDLMTVADVLRSFEVQQEERWVCEKAVMVEFFFEFYMPQRLEH